MDRKEIIVLELKELIIRKREEIKELKKRINSTITGIAVKDFITAIRLDIREVRQEISKIEQG